MFSSCAPIDHMVESALDHQKEADRILSLGEHRALHGCKISLLLLMRLVRAERPMFDHCSPVISEADPTNVVVAFYLCTRL